MGAAGGLILRLVMRKSTLTALLGVVMGLAGASAGTRVLKAFLWSTTAQDPKVFLGGSVLLYAVVLIASYPPARRATRVDPVEIMKAPQ